MIWVIIPALNEEKALPATLNQLFSQAGNYHVVVVDGGSVDATREIVLAEPRARLLVAAKGRAVQMNAGAYSAIQAGAAPDDWLLFLHADTLLPDGALRRLNAMETDLSCRAGGFMHRFSGADCRLRLISWLNNLRCRCSGIIYGDQAMFVRTGLFQQLGGFPDQAIPEDMAFSEQMVRHAKPVLLNPPVVTDARKFIKMGIWRSAARAFLIILCVQLRIPMPSRAFFQDIR
jgi:rSAM/selenodomain-associated transferase 2